MAKEDQIVVQYGLEVLIETLAKLIFMICLGFLVNRQEETITILVSFCSLRFFAGGLHLKTNFGCTSAFLFIWIVALGMYQFVIVSDNILL